MSSPRSYEIVHADAFAWLRKRDDESIHAVVTDPPYSVVEYDASQLKKKREGTGGGVWRLPQSFDGFDRKPVPRFTDLTLGQKQRLGDFHKVLATDLLRVLVPGAHVILASQNVLSYLVLAAFMEAGFEPRGQIARIVKTLRGGDRPKGAHTRFENVSVIPRSNWEPWFIFRKPMRCTVREALEKWGTGALRRPSKDSPFTDLVTCPPPRRSETDVAPHPSLKPQALMRRLVHAALPLGTGVLLDPFMGSGSTIAAADALAIRSIGIEKDARFFALAKKAIPKLAALPVDFPPAGAAADAAAE